MTWQTAKADAEVLAARMIQRIRAAEEGGQKVAQVQLAEYRDIESYQFLRPGEVWTWPHHLAVIRASERILRRAGYEVRRVPIGLTDYLDFIARYDLKNTTANRAQFISWATSPNSKP